MQNEEKIIDTRTAEEILATTDLSYGWIKDAFGNVNIDASSELEGVKERLDNTEWKPKEPENPFQAALNWQRSRQNKASIRQVMSYNDAKYLFFEFWKTYLPETQDFYLHPDNKATVQNI